MGRPFKLTLHQHQEAIWRRDGDERLDTDNDSVFILISRARLLPGGGIAITRCRPYRKNDQCWPIHERRIRCGARWIPWLKIWI